MQAETGKDQGQAMLNAKLLNDLILVVGAFLLGMSAFYIWGDSDRAPQCTAGISAVTFPDNKPTTIYYPKGCAIYPANTQNEPK